MKLFDRNSHVTNAAPILPPDEGHSLFGLNHLPPAERDAHYRLLIPDVLVTRFNLDLDAPGILRITALPGAGSAEIELRHRPDAQDPLLYLQLADTMNHQLELVLIVLNDPDGRRYDTDRLPDGRHTQFGTEGRNLAAELAARKAGLAPGQVRPGLHAGRAVVRQFDVFAAELGQALWLLQPLAYHNAILFERWGCTYLNGRSFMEYINREFRPGGILNAQLDRSTPFRLRGAWRSVRGRSWAIYDGALGQPFTGITMYKHVGKDAGVHTAGRLKW